MDREVKKMYHYGIMKVFKYHKNLFPCRVTKIHIKHLHDNTFSLIFINENIDVTAKIFEAKELYEMFYSAVQKIGNQFNYNEEKYFEPYEPKVLPKIYLDKNLVSKLRGNKSVSDFSSAIDLHTSTIYSVERGEEVNTSIKTLVNYSLFFKVPLFRLFLAPYKKEFLKILLNDFIIKGYIDEVKAKEILEQEIKKM